MREENPTPNNSTGPKTAKDKLEDLNARLTRNSLFDTLAEYEHDYRETDGKRVHDYRCRRCALTVRLNGLRNQVQALIRDVKDAIGEMRDG
jgi:hypothetical protein